MPVLDYCFLICALSCYSAYFPCQTTEAVVAAAESKLKARKVNVTRSEDIEET